MAMNLVDFEKTLEALLRGLANPSKPQTVEERNAEIEQSKVRLIGKAQKASKEVIGLPFRVRVGRNEIYTGKITFCEVAGFRVRQNSVIVQFNVRINALPMIVVETLPR